MPLSAICNFRYDEEPGELGIAFVGGRVSLR